MRIGYDRSMILCQDGSQKMPPLPLAGTSVVVDTNVWVAAAFHPRSCSARIVDAIRSGRLRMVWNEQTRNESKRILSKIPPISWSRFAGLFLMEARFDAPLDLDAYAVVPDADDRKFAALAHATNSILITQDRHLLAQASCLPARVLSPSRFASEMKLEPRETSRSRVPPRSEQDL